MKNASGAHSIQCALLAEKRRLVSGIFLNLSEFDGKGFLKQKAFFAAKQTLFKQEMM